MKRILILAAAILLTAFGASAHAFLETASPRVGSSVSEAPKEIAIVYTEAVEPSFSHIALFAADGKEIALGAPAIDPSNDKRLIAPVKAQLAPGHYEVKWNVVAVDTHHTNGHFSFDYQP